MSSLNPANLIPAVRTAPAASADWMRTRFTAALAAVAAALPGVAAAVRNQLARTILAHWWRETGRHAEWNYAVGNIKAYPSQWTGHYHRLSDGQNYRSYDSLAAAAANYLHLISSGRYAPSWAYALAHPTDATGWYSRLLTAGYSPLSPAALREIANLRHNVDAFIGAA